MANPSGDNASMRRVTTGLGEGYFVPETAEEQASFIRAVTVGLNDLETGRELSFVDAVIRLGLDLNEAPSRLVVGTAHSSPMGD